MWCKKLSRYLRKPRWKIFIMAHCLCSGGVVRGQGIDWGTQIEAIKQLAGDGYLREAEQAGRILLDGVEGERANLLELLGGFCIRDGRYRQAADYYLQGKDAVEGMGGNRYLVLAGDAYYRNGDYGLAAAIYGECYRREADDEILFRYGMALLHGDSYDEGEKLDFRNRRIRARFDWNCAVYWHRRDRWEKVCQYLEPWVEELGLMACYFYAQAAHRSGRIKEALRVMEIGGRMYYEGCVDERYYGNLLRLGLRIAVVSGDREGAEAMERNLRKRGKDLGLMLLWKVMALVEAGRWEEVLVELGELGKYYGEEALYLRGEAYLRGIGGGIGEAEEVFREVGKGEGKLGYIGRLRFGDTEGYGGNFEGALEVYIELEQEVEGARWIGRGEEVREYIREKIGRSRLRHFFN
jgi:hypothetical protein